MIRYKNIDFLIFSWNFEDFPHHQISRTVLGYEIVLAKEIFSFFEQVYT